MISEETIAQRMGLTRVAIASLRRERLIEGEDWVMEGRRVMITGNGPAKLLAAVGLAPEGQLEADEATRDFDMEPNGFLSASAKDYPTEQHAPLASINSDASALSAPSQHSDNGGSTPPGAAEWLLARAHLEEGLEIGAGDAAQEGLSAPERAAEVTLVITSKRPPRNQHIIEAKFPEPLDVATWPGKVPVVRVRVPSNANFLPGMEIRARPSEDYPDVFVLVGRCPRYRGRW